MKTIYEAFSDAQKALEELGAIVNATTQPEPKKPNAVFKPELYQEYWVIDVDGEVRDTQWEDFSFDNDRYNQGNCYATKAEALHVMNQRETLQRLRELADFVPDWANHNQKKYVPAYMPKTKNWCVAPCSIDIIFCCGFPPFPSTETLDAAIAELGDRMDYLLPYGVKK